MKSGTSTLNMHLDSHPEIFMCTPREPSYFVEHTQLRKIWPKMEAEGYWRCIDKYLALFAQAGSAKIIGESSTNYTKLNRLTGVAERISKFSTDAKILYIMRDPVERTISHYWHHVRHHGESRDPMTALAKDSQYTDTSYYAMQLRPYFDRFPEKNIFTLSFEDLVTDIPGNLKRIYSWLEVDESFMPETIHKKLHVTPEKLVQVQGVGVLSGFAHSRFWDMMSKYVPRDLRRYARRFSEREVDVTSEKQMLVEYLRPIHFRQTEELVKLLGRDFSEWKTLYNNG